jgi:hypothetical protein
METYSLATVARQLGKIREEIRFNGFFVVGCEELDFLCADRAPEEERTEWLKQIGESEGWDVERQPDGKVRLSTLLTLLVSDDGFFVSHPQRVLADFANRPNIFGEVLPSRAPFEVPQSWLYPSAT